MGVTWARFTVPRGELPLLPADANPMEIGEAEHPDLGLGRVEWKKGVTGVGEGVVTMRDTW